MIKLTEYAKLEGLLPLVSVETVYPRSIVEGTQRGEVFVDDIDDPRAALFWHYCGFANFAGHCDERIAAEIHEYMIRPLPGHSDRLCLQLAEGDPLCEMIAAFPDVKRGERYIFGYAGSEPAVSLGGAQLVRIDESNYDLLRGRIIPAFSWPSRDEFLEHGFGFCIIEDGQALACAFSSAICAEAVDIGVETAEAARGRGFGKAVSAAMAREVIRTGRTPVWDCDIHNEASKRLALSVGFETVGTHPWFKLQ